MKATPLAIPDVLLLEPPVFEDARGFFFESWNARAFAEVIGTTDAFVQDNHSCSARHVLRGLHYQVGRPQGKLLRVVAGEIFDVAVDIRRSSPTFGRWVGTVLSARNRQQVWIPPGFAHGFLTLAEGTEVLYKTTDYWSPEHERCIAWNDADLAVTWPIAGEPVVSVNDARGVRLRDAEVFA